MPADSAEGIGVPSPSTHARRGLARQQQGPCAPGRRTWVIRALAERTHGPRPPALHLHSPTHPPTWSWVQQQHAASWGWPCAAKMSWYRQRVMVRLASPSPTASCAAKPRPRSARRPRSREVIAA